MADLRQWTEWLCKYLDTYRLLLDSYIIEYFTESHWSKLPPTWQESLKTVSLQQFCYQMFGIHCPPIEHQSHEALPTILPLSLLAFSATASALSYPIYPTYLPNSCDNLSQIPGLSHIFRRHVKPKKQYELIELGKTVKNLCQRVDCNNVIDIGCGQVGLLTKFSNGASVYAQGHLARYLAFHCGMNVTAVEAIGCHLETAVHYDREVTEDIGKAFKRERRDDKEIKIGSINYIEQMIDPTVSSDHLISQLKLSSSIEDKYVLVGLHTCGDLATTMLRLFTETNKAVGLISVGCCYMKLSDVDTPLLPLRGYPISKTVATIPGHHLSYEAKEVACHSKEMYMKRLIDGSDHLTIHCYRAAVETVLRQHGLRRPQLKISKRVSKLPFKKYARAVIESVGIIPTEEEIESMDVLLRQWQHVVMYFLLRLTMAPCIETLILLDRVLFLQEKGIKTRLQTLFDPLLSPRNLVLIADKVLQFSSMEQM